MAAHERADPRRARPRTAPGTAWVFLLALRHDAAATAAGAAAVLLAGAAWSQGDLVSLYSQGGGPPEGDAVVAGRVALTPERRGEATALVLERARLRVGGRTFAASPPVELLVDGGAGRYRIGDLLTARGRCAAVRGDRNLGRFPRPAVPRGRRRAARVYVSSPLWVRRDGRDPGTGADAAVLRWREAASRFWGRTSQPAGAILDALTTGERSSVPAAAEEAFGRAGLTHLLAISGMNVAYLAALVYLALRRLLALVEPLALPRPVHPFAAAATLPALWFFYRFSGSQIPVGRATAAIAAAMVAVILWRLIDAADGIRVLASLHGVSRRRTEALRLRHAL